MLEAGLILLEPNPKCEGFDDLIDELVSLFERFCPDPSLLESHEFSEEELKKLIQKILIQMKDRYPSRFNRLKITIRTLINWLEF